MENQENKIIETIEEVDISDKKKSSFLEKLISFIKKDPKKAITIACVIIAVVVVGIGSISNLSNNYESDGSSNSGKGGGVTDDMYIGVAKQIIAKSLKKPSSLEVNDAYIYEKDAYGSAIVCMDITSENGYGGADRDTVYVCVMYLESDGSYQFHPSYNYTENVTNLDVLKSINGFGEPEE